jgi:hypothetical protein
MSAMSLGCRMLRGGVYCEYPPRLSCFGKLKPAAMLHYSPDEQKELIKFLTDRGALHRSGASLFDFLRDPAEDGDEAQHGV